MTGRGLRTPSLVKLKKTTEILIQDSRSPCQDLNSERLEYEVVLTTRPQKAVTVEVFRWSDPLSKKSYCMS
jgi:hypothetical protein